MYRRRNLCDSVEKKEIDDKTPKLRTEDENKTLRLLFNKMRKFPKDLIAEIKNKCLSLQRKPAGLYLAGNFKNLYSDHRSIFLRIPTDNNVIPVSPPINENT